MTQFFDCSCLAIPELSRFIFFPVEEVVQRDQDICMWKAEEKMEAWQIDLYHRNTEDGGIHIQRNAAAVTNKSNDRFNLRDRDKVKLTPRHKVPQGFKPGA